MTYKGLAGTWLELWVQPTENHTNQTIHSVEIFAWWKTAFCRALFKAVFFVDNATHPYLHTAFRISHRHFCWWQRQRFTWCVDLCHTLERNNMGTSGMDWEWLGYNWKSRLDTFGYIGTLFHLSRNHNPPLPTFTTPHCASLPCLSPLFLERRDKGHQDVSSKKKYYRTNQNHVWYMIHPFNSSNTYSMLFVDIYFESQHFIGAFPGPYHMPNALCHTLPT